MAENNPLHPSVANAGLNTQSTQGQVQPGELSYALNAMIEGASGESITYQNEMGNTLCTTLPDGYKAVGVFSVPSKDMVVYLLTNPLTGDSEIGASYNNSCTYSQIISDKGQDHKLGFDIRYPVHRMHSKVSNCGMELYWTDGLNPRYYLNLESLPWKEVPDPNNDFKPVQLVGTLDVNKMLVEPHFSVPNVVPLGSRGGGQLRMGVYQFAVAYSNSKGNAITEWYGINNPIPVFQQQVGAEPDALTSRAIDIKVEHLDTSGLYDYFTIAVIKTINGTRSANIVATLPISSREQMYTYTGTDKAEISIDPTEIIKRFNYYNTAKGSFEVDGVLGFYDLEGGDNINYQEIWSQVPVLWETYKVPYRTDGGYTEPINSALYKTYPRDEVIALEGYFILRNGERTKGFHIPGRVAKAFDREKIDTNNPDAQAINTTKCEDPLQLERWQVYNTGTLLGYTEAFLNSQETEDCYVGPYQYGEMAYWESIKTYANNPLIYGDLAGKPIRHHKLPDNVITHIHDNSVGDARTYEHSIYPIGFRIHEGELRNAIKNSSLTQQQKDNIVGWGILRGNRAGGNRSIEAKGLFTNVGEYTFKEKKYLYANYPFNDLRKDPYFTTELLEDHSGFRPDKSLSGFSGDGSKERFTFYSPNTLFPDSSPKLVGDGSLSIKLETIEYGTSYGHFVQVEDNAEYKFLTKGTMIAASGLALSSGMIIGAGTYGWPHYSIGSAIPTFKDSMELFEKLAPYTNFGWQHNALGYYGSYFPIPNNGMKQRNVEYTKYLVEGMESVENGRDLNNISREGSVYIKARSAVLFPHEYSDVVPEDTSRYTASSIGKVEDDISEFFAYFDESRRSFTQRAVNHYIYKTSLYNGNNEGTMYLFDIHGPTSFLTPTIGQVITIGTQDFKVRFIDTEPDFSTTSATDYKGILIAEPVLPLPVFSSFTATGTITVHNGTSTYPITYSSIAVVSSFDLYYRIPETYVDDLEFYILELDSLQEMQDYLAADGTTNEGYLKHQAAGVAFEYYHRYISDKSKAEPALTRETDISAYYGSIKRYVPDQYGALYSYETIDTGFRKMFNDFSVNRDGEVIFGGDTTINRFGFKKKLSLFKDTTVKDDNGTDIQYDEIANYGYPMFWLSTKPRKFDIDITAEVNRVREKVESLSFLDAIGGIFSGGGSNVKPSIDLIVKVFREIYEKIGVKNVNLDMFNVKGLVEQGIMYLFNYGIPYFFVESDINTDYRQATNLEEGNFYPNTGEGVIPDRWLQEVTVPIERDNTYNYNPTYSKQNKELFVDHLRDNYDPTKKCSTTYPNRVIWSERSDIEESKNHWLSYLPASVKDLPKTYGNLTSIDAIENRQLLVRFEDRAQLYNALTTVQVSQGPEAYLGNSELFSGPPLDLSVTDVGHGGSQHKMFIKTEHGYVYVSSRMGSVILVTGSGPGINLSDLRMKAWFANHLPFELLKTFPSYPIDNALNGIGITGVYDSRFDRIVITKKDYKPLVDGIELIDGRFYYGDKEVFFEDTEFFCDRSWSVSYRFPIPGYFSGGWISFHSYQPNYYVELPNHFLSGVQGDHVWVHGKTNTLYNHFYGNLYPYILEYPISYGMNDEILQSVSDYCTALRWEDDIPYEPEGVLYFNKAILYNKQQCSGLLVLVPRPQNNLRALSGYPKYFGDRKEILVTKSDHFYKFNTFWNIQNNPNVPAFKPTCSTANGDKELNNNVLDYSRRSHAKGVFRAKDLKIRLIMDDKSDVNLVTRFMLSPTTPSIK